MSFNICLVSKARGRERSIGAMGVMSRFVSVGHTLQRNLPGRRAAPKRARGATRAIPATEHRVTKGAEHDTAGHQQAAATLASTADWLGTCTPMMLFLAKQKAESRLLAPASPAHERNEQPPIQGRTANPCASMHPLFS